MRTTRSRILRCGIAALVILQSGCSGESGSTEASLDRTESDSSSGSTSQSDGSGTSVSAGSKTPDSVDELMVLDDTTERTLDEAWRKEVAKCMTGRGRTYDPSPPPTTPSAHDLLVPFMDDRGYPTESTLRADGYAWRSNVLMNQTFAATPDPDPDLDECGATATITLRQDELNRVEKLFFDADAERQVWEKSSPDVQSLMAEWSRCMGSAGYDVENFDQAITRAQDAGFTSDDGTSISIQDFACRREISFNERIRPIREKYVAEWLATNQDTIEAFKSARDTALSIAQATT